MDSNEYEPPLTLFAWHSVPYYNGRNGQYREFFLFPSNRSGVHEWPTDPQSHDVYHCSASASCTSFCGVASRIGADVLCASAPPPAPQTQLLENTGWLFISVSGHFLPDVTISGDLLFQWLDVPPPPQPPAKPPPPPPSPSLAPLHPPPLAPPSLLFAPRGPPRLELATATASAIASQEQGTPVVSGFPVRTTLLITCISLASVVACCALVVLLACRCCACKVSRKANATCTEDGRTAAPNTDECEPATLHDLLGRPIRIEVTHTHRETEAQSNARSLGDGT